MSERFRNAVHVSLSLSAQDLLVNGQQIFGDVSDAMVQWDARKYQRFGKDIGEALFKLVVKEQESETA